jgi:hypothetical protein
LQLTHFFEQFFRIGGITPQIGVLYRKFKLLYPVLLGFRVKASLRAGGGVLEALLVCSRNLFEAWEQN